MHLQRALDIAYHRVAYPATGAEQTQAFEFLADHVQDLRTLINSARALHVPDGSHDCRACNAHVTTGEPVQWPCPTAAALGTPRVVLTVEWEPS